MKTGTLWRMGTSGLRKMLVCSSLILAAGAYAQHTEGEDSQEILTIDHYVQQTSHVPSIEGQYTQLYVRERVRPATIMRPGSLEGRVALFVHGGVTPSEVVFDVPYEDYSWMAYLAAADFDVFAVDMTGYGRSTRPHYMNDPCNLSEDDQRSLGIGVALGPCEPSYRYPMTTFGSDWADISRVVDYIRELRQVEKVSLLGWSRGGPRAGGYAAQNPDKVDKLVFLAPEYPRASRAFPTDPPRERAEGVAMMGSSRERFTATWERQVGCSNQYDPIVRQIVWSEALKSDPVGATWGGGTYRAPRSLAWGWNKDIVSRIMTPTLLIAGELDGSVPPDRVRNLYEDLGAESKVFIDLACASHNAPWESNRLLLFRASLEWLRDGTVDGTTHGVIRMGN